MISATCTIWNLRKLSQRNKISMQLLAFQNEHMEQIASWSDKLNKYKNSSITFCLVFSVFIFTKKNEKATLNCFYKAAAATWCNSWKNGSPLGLFPFCFRFQYNPRKFIWYLLVPAHLLLSAAYCRFIIILSDIKIVQFRNGLEGRASQMSSVQVLLNTKDLLNPEPEGIKLQSGKCFFWFFNDTMFYLQSKL